MNKLENNIEILDKLTRSELEVELYVYAIIPKCSGAIIRYNDFLIYLSDEIHFLIEGDE